MGLRRRGPGLSLPGLLALLLVGSLAGCLGLDEEDEARLLLFQQNSQDFYQKGAYQQALHQANMALVLDEDLVGMRLIRGFCLTKLGQNLGNVELIDQAVTLFDQLTQDAPEDYRTWLGSGQAHLAMALQHQAEMGRIERRLDSDFLDDFGRMEEERWLTAEQEALVDQLAKAESALQHVLDDTLQKDNPYAMIDMVLVLTTEGGRDDEALACAYRAVDLIEESIGLTKTTLQKNANLPPDGKMTLERRIEDNLNKQRMLLGIIISTEYRRGAWQACLEAYEVLEEKRLMGANEYFNRAAIFERLGMHARAVDDLEAYLRLRARQRDYDEMASTVFDRIAMLRALEAGDAPPN